MLIRFFKSSQPATLFVLPFLALLCWLAAYFTLSLPISYDGMPLATHFMNWISGWSGFSKTLVAFLLVGFQAIYLNYIVNNHEVLYKQTNLTGFWYIILMALVPGGMFLQPVLIVNTLLIFLLNKILKLYKLDEPTGTVFDSTFLIGLSTLFFLPSILLLPVFFISLSMLRPFSAREWMVGFAGIILPFFLLWSAGYLMDQPIVISEIFKTALTHYGFLSSLQLTPETGLSFGILILILGFAILKLIANISKNVIRTRKYQRILIIFLVATAIGALSGDPWNGKDFQFLVIPLSILFAYYFLASKRVWWTEGLTLLLIGSIVYRYLYQTGMVQ